MSSCICIFCALGPSSAFGLKVFFLLLPHIMHSFLLCLVTSLFLKLRKQLEARKTLWEHRKGHCAPWRAYWLIYCSWYDKINKNNNNVKLCFSWKCLKIYWPGCDWFLVCTAGHFRGFLSLHLASPPPSAFRLPPMLFAACFTCFTCIACSAGAWDYRHVFVSLEHPNKMFQMKEFVTHLTSVQFMQTDCVCCSQVSTTSVEDKHTEKMPLIGFPRDSIRQKPD